MHIKMMIATAWIVICLVSGISFVLTAIGDISTKEPKTAALLIFGIAQLISAACLINSAFGKKEE